MFGLDIASYQAKMDVTKIPGDFIIIKATQGTSYVNPCMAKHYDQAKRSGKLLGLYHYFSNGNAKAEADHFLKTVGSRLGEAVLVLDWERYQNEREFDRGPVKAKEFLDYVKAKTGVSPLIYTGKAEVRSKNYSAIRDAGYGLWGAQYPNYNRRGYETPWRDGKYWGAYGDESNLDIRQYTSAGMLKGYSGNLDLNYSRLTADQWRALAKGKKAKPTPKPTPSNNGPSGSTLDLTVKTLKGQYGNDDARKKNLGKRYTDVQGLINHISGASVATLKAETLKGVYGNGDIRKTVLGAKYKAVQDAINGGGRKSIDTVAREVIQGKWGNDPQRSQKLRAAGYDPKAVQRRVNQLL